MKSFRFLLICSVAFIVSFANGDEDNCGLFGGECIARSRCDTTLYSLMPDGLCKNGRACCNFFKPTCKSKGGECRADCPEIIRHSDVKDCAHYGTHCCVWLR